MPAAWLWHGCYTTVAWLLHGCTSPRQAHVIGYGLPELIVKMMKNPKFEKDYQFNHAGCAAESRPLDLWVAVYTALPTHARLASRPTTTKPRAHEMESCARSVSILRFVTAGEDPKANERGKKAAEPGTLKVLIDVIALFPKKEGAKRSSVKGNLAASMHLVDHAVAAIRNITACSEDLGRQAREAGAQQAWVAKR